MSMEEMITLRVGNEESDIYLTNEEYNYLSSLSPHFINNEWDKVTDINDKIIALFTISRYKDAWDMMEENPALINYNRIKKNPYFVISPNYPSLFKYLWNNSIIDDKEYSYYDVLSGHLSKIFWDNYIKKNNCKSFSDICGLVAHTFNGLNNDDVPMITMGDYEFSLMAEYMQEDEKLDEFVYDKPAFLFPIETLYMLIEEGHFEDINKILQIISELISDNKTDPDDVELHDFWTFASENMTTNKNFMINNSSLLLSLISFWEGDKDLFMKLIVNSGETRFFVHTINEKIKERNNKFNEELPLLNDINISDYLDDDKMGLVVPYKLCELNTSDYKTFGFAQNLAFAVINNKNNSILFGNNIYDATEFANLKVWSEYKDDPDYKFHEMSDFEKGIFKINNENMATYKEFMYAVLNLIGKE